jgi:hypothetical protein
MATTKIWPVRGWLSQVLIYVDDPKKTERPRFFEKPNMSAGAAQGLEDVIDYAMAQEKTVADEGDEMMRYFVSGINCTPGSARDEMMATKTRYEKKGGIVAYHGYQSFKPGEVTPEVAHEIGVKLATELWGERFQIIVATHLDKDHIHNHFVCNSVSFTDGGRFRSNKGTYRKLREASDELCKEYGLSVIENPKRGRTRHHTERQAERDGKPTWRSHVKSDIDECIARAKDERQFFENLLALGYEYKVGKDISVRPPGKERPLRLARNFGESYSIEGIRAQIRNPRRRHKMLPVPKRRPPNFTPPKKLPAASRGSIVALHRHYLYLLGYYQQRGSPATNARMHWLLREDLRKLDDYIADTRLLGRKGIESAGQLRSFQAGCEAEIATLISERAKLKAEIRAEAGFGNPYTTKDNPRYQQINVRLKKLRKEVVQCARIDERSRTLHERIGRIERDEDKKLQSKDRKEEKKDGRNRAGNRPEL